MEFRSTLFTTIAALGAIALTAAPASAQLGRAINVNGQWLNPQQIAQADEIAGFRLPNGFYWWNPQACAWGVVGNPVPVGPGPCGDGGGGMGGGSRPRVDWNRSGGPVIAPGDCEGGRCVNIPPDLK
jgi:hypothetical protein